MSGKQRPELIVLCLRVAANPDLPPLHRVKLRCRQCREPVWRAEDRREFPTGYRLSLVCLECAGPMVRGRTDLTMLSRTKVQTESLLLEGIDPAALDALSERLMDDLAFPRRYS